MADNILRRSMESDACDDWREKDLVGSSERSSERVDAHFMAFIMNACHRVSIVPVTCSLGEGVCSLHARYSVPCSM